MTTGERARASYLSRAADHDVVAVPVSDAEDVRGHTVARARQGELLDGPLKSVAANTKHFKHIGFPGLWILLRRAFWESYPEFLSLSQFSRASLLKAAAAATLLLVSWMLAMVSADETTSISPERSPVARQPYGTILQDTRAQEKQRA